MAIHPVGTTPNAGIPTLSGSSVLGIDATRGTAQLSNYSIANELTQSWGQIAAGNMEERSFSAFMPQSAKDQLAAMRDKWMVVAEPEGVYYEENTLQTPYSHVLNQTSEAKFGWHPTPGDLVNDAASLRSKLYEAGLSEVYIAGITSVAQAPENRLDIASRSRVQIALAGGIRTGQDLLNLLQQRIHNQVGQTSQKNQAPLIIENNNGFWSPFLKSFQADKDLHHFQLWLETLGVHITEGREQTLEMATKLALAPSNDLSWEGSTPLVPNGSTIFVATATRKKFDQIKAIYAKLGLDVHICFIHQLFTYQSAVEEMRTFEGNTYEKLEQAFYGWNQLTPEEQNKALKTLGLNPNKVFFMAEDSGLRFADHRVAKSAAFQGLNHLMYDDRDFPGVETGPIGSGTYGWPMVFKEAAMVQAGLIDAVLPFDNKMYSTAVVALAPLDQSRMIQTSSMIEGKWRSESASNKTHQIEDYFTPGSKDLTERERGKKYFEGQSSRARATDALTQLAGLKPVEGLSDSYYDYAGEFRVTVMDQPIPFVDPQATTEISSINQNPIFNPDRLNRLSDVQNLFFDTSESIVLSPNPATYEQDFWRNLFVFASPLVGRHTYDMHLAGKDFTLYDPSGTFDPFHRLMYDLHLKGTVPEDPTELFTYVKTPEALQEHLAESRKSYMPYVPPVYPHKIIRNNTTSMPPRYTTSVFLSSVNRNQTMLDNASQIVQSLSDNGHGVRSGAGYEGGMGAITRLATQRREEGLNVYHSGASVPNIMEGPAGEGNVIEQMDVFHQAPNIYERIEYLLQSDSFITDIGGPGTVQELAAWAWLKSRALKNPNDSYIKEKFPKIAHSKMFLINTEIERGVNFWDYLITMIPKEDFEKLGLVVVPDAETAIRLNQEFMDDLKFNEA